VHDASQPGIMVKLLRQAVHDASQPVPVCPAAARLLLACGLEVLLTYAPLPFHILLSTLPLQLAVDALGVLSPHTLLLLAWGSTIAFAAAVAAGSASCWRKCGCLLLVRCWRC
jgi:hypothetical protein